MSYRYRVNFGNGQVQYVDGNTKKACYAYLANPENNCGGWAFVEFEDPDTGDWFRLGTEK